MSEFKHTPGPWLHRDNGIYARDAQPEWAVDDEDFADERICVVNLLGGMGGDDCAADANLIAAAPEILAMLEQVAEGHALHSDICDLIAKVKGTAA